MHGNEISEKIIGAAIKVHKARGPGLLELIYELALAYELAKMGLKVERQKPVHIEYDGQQLGEGFRWDLLVEDKVGVELKSVEQVTALFKKKVNTQVRLAKLRLGLLVNFNVVLLKDGNIRVVNGLTENE